MKKVFNLIPFILSVCLVAGVLIYQNTIAKKYYESNRLLMQDTIALIETGDFNEEALSLIKDILNDEVSDNQAMQERGTKIVLCIGILCAVFSFPVKLFFKNG